MTYPQHEIPNATFISDFELIAKLRMVPLMGFNQVQPYKGADIDIITVHTDSLIPAQRYVLESGIKTIEDIRENFLKFGVDVFSLQCGVLFTQPGSDEITPFLPPVVEETTDQNGNMVLLINDGMHRISAARKANLPINVIRVRNVPEEYPYYAYPNPNGWQDVTVLQELTPEYKRKEYRVPEDYKSLFRNFNAVFPNVQVSRSAGFNM